MSKTYKNRFIARVVLEAASPLAIGTGLKNTYTDAPVIKDINGFPYLPATSLCGLLRHLYAAKELSDSYYSADELFGFQAKDDEGEGSRIVLSDAKIVGYDGRVIDGLNIIDQNNTQEVCFYDAFQYLPIREHVRINHKGTTRDQGKFDQEVVYKGTRFCFEMEFLADGDTQKMTLSFKILLSILSQVTFRLGGKTASGYGQMVVVSIHQDILDLDDPIQKEHYLEKSSDLSDMSFWTPEKQIDVDSFLLQEDQSITYQLDLKSRDFILFGAASADQEADQISVKEDILSWDVKGYAVWLNEQMFIPGSSIKGAIAHRVAFHYNKMNKVFAEFTSETLLQHVESNNEAVKAIFGFTSEAAKDNQMQAQKGNILFSDLFITGDGHEQGMEKILDHVTINRFTGGALDGHLFSEKVYYNPSYNYQILVHIRDKRLLSDIFEAALERSLEDITTGMLPLGGGVNRGHGCFEGTIKKINK